MLPKKIALGIIQEVFPWSDLLLLVYNYSYSFSFPSWCISWSFDDFPTRIIFCNIFFATFHLIYERIPFGWDFFSGWWNDAHWNCMIFSKYQLENSWVFMLHLQIILMFLILFYFPAKIINKMSQNKNLARAGWQTLINIKIQKELTDKSFVPVLDLSVDSFVRAISHF